MAIIKLMIENVTSTCCLVADIVHVIFLRGLKRERAKTTRQNKNKKNDPIFVINFQLAKMRLTRTNYTPTKRKTQTFFFPVWAQS